MFAVSLCNHDSIRKTSLVIKKKLSDFTTSVSNRTVYCDVGVGSWTGGSQVGWLFYRAIEVEGACQSETICRLFPD